MSKYVRSPMVLQAMTRIASSATLVRATLICSLRPAPLRANRWLSTKLKSGPSPNLGQGWRKARYLNASTRGPHDTPQLSSYRRYLIRVDRGCPPWYGDGRARAARLVRCEREYPGDRAQNLVGSSGGEEGSVTAVVEDDEGADDKPRSHEGERKGQDVR